MKNCEIDRARLPIRARIFAAGATCALATNSQDVIDSFSRVHPFSETRPEPCFELNVLVDPSVVRDERANPHFRGMDHLVFALFNGEMFAFDLNRKLVFGVVSPDTAGDCTFWNGVLLPVAVGLLGITMGIVPLHAACLDRNGEGVLLAGLSGAGKSTLAVALSQRGFSLLSDDWTYVTSNDGGLTAHGLRAPVKLLPDSVRFFPHLGDFRPRRSLNGEVAFEVDAEHALGARVCQVSRPSKLLFLERIAGSGCEFAPLVRDDVKRFFETSAERLSPEFASVAANRSRVIKAIVELDCWLLRSGASPGDTAEAVKRFCDGFASQGAGTPAAGIECGGIAPDLLKRFVDMPFSGRVAAGGEDVLVRSNDSAMIDAVDCKTSSNLSRKPSFVWKLVRDDDAEFRYDEAISLACGAVVIAKFGSACLAAVDYEQDELIAFLRTRGDYFALRDKFLPLFRKLTARAMSVRPSNTREMQRLAMVGGTA